MKVISAESECARVYGSIAQIVQSSVRCKAFLNNYHQAFGMKGLLGV